MNPRRVAASVIRRAIHPPTPASGSGFRPPTGRLAPGFRARGRAWALCFLQARAEALSLEPVLLAVPAGQLVEVGLAAASALRTQWPPGPSQTRSLRLPRLPVASPSRAWKASPHREAAGQFRAAEFGACPAAQKQNCPPSRAQ